MLQIVSVLFEYMPTVKRASYKLFTHYTYILCTLHDEHEIF